MKKLVLIIVVLLSIAPSSKGQYSLMTKGERCPFDSAVAIQIDTYRLESRKMKLADSLINDLSFQVQTVEEMIFSLNKQLIYADNLLDVKDDMIFAKQQTINELLKQIAYQPEKSWWEKNHKPVLFLGGITVGIGGTVLLLNLLK